MSPFDSGAVTELVAALTPWPGSGDELARRLGAEPEDRGDSRVFSFVTSISSDVFALISPTAEPPLTLYCRQIDPAVFAGLVAAVEAESAPRSLAVTTDWLSEFGSGEIHLWPAAYSAPLLADLDSVKG